MVHTLTNRFKETNDHLCNCIIKPNHKIISKLVVTVGSLQLNYKDNQNNAGTTI